MLRDDETSLIRHLIGIFERYKIDTVIDVGANRGHFALEIRKAGYQGVIHSFEPISDTFEKLSTKSQHDPNWFVHKVALGDVGGKKNINVAEKRLMSSILEPNSFGQERFPGVAISRRETINITTLDSFFDRLVVKDNTSIFLKIDTQGYDLKVFKGATRIMPHICGLMTEVSLIEIYEEAPHYLQSLKIFEYGGFSVTGFFPVSRNEDYSLIEMDCVMIKRQNTSTRR